MKDLFKQQTYQLVRKYEEEDKPELAKFVLLVYLQMEDLRAKTSQLVESLKLLKDLRSFKS